LKIPTLVAPSFAGEASLLPHGVLAKQDMPPSHSALVPLGQGLAVSQFSKTEGCRRASQSSGQCNVCHKNAKEIKANKKVKGGRPQIWQRNTAILSMRKMLERRSNEEMRGA
jgi:hypothetical protein